MNITFDTYTSDIAVLHPEGRLDLLTSGDAKRQMQEALGSGHLKLVIDLGDVTFIDSSGLGTLIATLKAARSKGGDLRIARPSEQAAMILELTTLNRVLRPYATVEEALVGYDTPPNH